MNTTYHRGFQEVTTKEEHEVFNNYWADVCAEYGVKFMPFHPNSQRFFIMNGTEPIGTIEFTKRAPQTFSICEDYFPFEQHEKVSKDHNSVFEMGKLSILKEHRRNGHLDKIIHCINFHAKTNNVKQYIGFMNLDLYKILRFAYKLPLDRLSEEGNYDRHRSLPVLCDVEKSRKALPKKLSI